METRFVLGVDGGGTKVDVLVTDEKGNVLGRSQSEATNIKAVSYSDAKSHLEKAVTEAMRFANMPSQTRFAAACFGFAGLNTPSDEKKYRHLLSECQFTEKLPHDTHVVNDAKIGLYSVAADGIGVLLIAGTGSNCYGRNEKRQEAKASGWDWMISDEGGAFYLGKSLLRSVMRAYDGRGPETSLTSRVLSFLHLPDELALHDWTYEGGFSKEKIASLAPLVTQAAKEGDNIARHILFFSTEELTLSVRTVVRKLGMATKEFPLICMGGMFRMGPTLLHDIKKKAGDFAPKADVQLLRKKPVVGAIRIAIQQSGNAKTL